MRPPERSRDASVFGFMSNDISAEINKGIAIRGTAREMRRAREAGEKIVVVAGPAIVHSGGDTALARLVRDGWVDVILTGNAFAVHDLEKSILKTSLGRLPDERPRRRGRQPQPPLRDQRGEPRGGHPRRGRAGARDARG